MNVLSDKVANKVRSQLVQMISEIIGSGETNDQNYPRSEYKQANDKNEGGLNKQSNRPETKKGYKKQEQ